MTKELSPIEKIQAIYRTNAVVRVLHAEQLTPTVCRGYIGDRFEKWEILVHEPDRLYVVRTISDNSSGIFFLYNGDNVAVQPGSDYVMSILEKIESWGIDLSVYLFDEIEGTRKAVARYIEKKHKEKEEK